MIRLGFAFVLALSACGGPKGKTESPLVNEGSAKPETCCCKSFPLTSENGEPAYEAGVNRMECSTKQGTCVDDVQCVQQAPTETPDVGEPGGDGDSSPPAVPTEAP